MLKSAIKVYWRQLAGLFVVLLLAIGPYLWSFRGAALSGRPEDWGSFGAYVSGTLGVAIVGATLLALMVTLIQQKKMLTQQEKVIQQQDDQLAAMDEHNKKMAAYDQADKLFPVLMSSFHNMLDMPVSDILESIPEFNIKLDEQLRDAYIKDLFFSDCMHVCFSNADINFQVVFSSTCLDRAFQLAEFMAECIEAAPEMKYFFKEKMSGSMVVIYCAVRYYHEFMRREKAQRVADQLDIPVNIGIAYVDAEIFWQKMGKQHTELLSK